MSILSNLLGLLIGLSATEGLSALSGIIIGVIVALIIANALQKKNREAKLKEHELEAKQIISCLLYTSPSPRDQRGSRMPASA